MSSNVSSHQTLAAAQDQLREKLAAQGENVSVRVDLTGGGSNGDSAGRESRGLDYMRRENE